MERKRKVTQEQLEKMSEEQLQKIEEKLGSKLREMVDRTCEEANKLLEIYGLQTKMQIVIEKKQ
jgi:frataxin-like iron-binding protein CyaY